MVPAIALDRRGTAGRRPFVGGPPRRSQRLATVQVDVEAGGTSQHVARHLADAARDVQESVLGRAGTPTEQAALRRTLADARRDGSLVFRTGAPWSVVSVAAPVRDDASAVVAALSIVVPETDSAPHHLRPAVRAAALGITRMLL